MVFQTSTEGKVLEVSPSVKNHLGYTRAELIGSRLEDIYYEPEDRQRILLKLKIRGAIQDEVIKFRSKEGHLIYTSVSAQLFEAIGEQPAYIEGVFTNITERMKYLEEIEDQNRRLREIAWIQSHVVRAPLARIMGLVEVFRHVDKDSKEYEEWTEHFFNSANELDTVIREISDKSRDIQIDK